MCRNVLLNEHMDCLVWNGREESWTNIEAKSHKWDVASWYQEKHELKAKTSNE